MRFWLVLFDGYFRFAWDLSDFHMNAVSPYSVLSVHMHKRDSGIQARWFSSRAQPVMHPGKILTESLLMALRLYIYI